MRFSLLRRREVITLLGGVAASWPLAAGAETNRLRRIGVLLNGPENNTEMRAEVFALQKGLRELGWMEGRNAHFEFCWPDGDAERTRACPAELVRLAPDVIVTVCPTRIPQ
jgi:putative tryptophan/tyrosine transport system substrate-binding protein